MAVNVIEGLTFYEKIIIQKSNKKDSGNEFYKSLSNTMDEKTEAKYEENKYNTKENADIKSYADNIDSKWDEALLQFYNFVEDRVKNGVPKYQIGASELSIDEWTHLLEKIDGNLDDIKEQLEEHIEKTKESQDESKNDKISEKLILELLRDRTDNDIMESDVGKIESVIKYKNEYER